MVGLLGYVQLRPKCSIKSDNIVVVKVARGTWMEAIKMDEMVVNLTKEIALSSERKKRSLAANPKSRLHVPV